MLVVNHWKTAWLVMTALFMIAVVGITGLRAAEEESDLADFSLDQLMDVKIVSLSKKPETARKAAAPIFVITREDIRRSGVTTIADALRMAPGVQVGKTDTTTWSVGIQHQQSEMTNNLLVLVDGRSVYNPIFSGTDWKVIDYLLEDVERIEVIRGPGAAIWGSNAVNGVINIITRNATDTQGGHLSVGSGTVDHAIIGMRYGKALSQSTYARVYAKGSERDGLDQNANASDIEWSDPTNDWRSGQGGFRIDAFPNDRDTFSLQGNVFRQLMDVRYSEPVTLGSYLADTRETAATAGAHLLGRWEHTFAPTSTLYVQAYYDYTDTDRLSVNGNVDTFDLEIGHYFEKGRHSFNMGLHGRINDYNFRNTWQQYATDRRVKQKITSLFVQDEISWFDGKLRTIFGCRVEQNSFSPDVEFQPDVRVAWNFHEKGLLWGSFSRAVRAPSFLDRKIDARLFGGTAPGIPVFPRLLSNEDFDTEKLKCFQIGLRVQPLPTVSLEVSAFHREYEDLLLTEQQSATVKTDPLMYVDVPFKVINGMQGESCGIELNAEWQVKKWWKLALAWSAVELDYVAEDHLSTGDIEGRVPDYQASLRSAFDLPKGFELDLWVRMVDEINGTGYEYDGYTTFDVRLGYHATENLNLSLTGRNLAEARHSEFSEFEVVRSLFLKADYNF